MKRYLWILMILLLPTLLTGCEPVGSKAASLSVVYGATAVCAFLLLVLYLCLVRKKEIGLLLLFLSVFVVDTGYFALAVSQTLEEALLANRISYLGSVFLPFSMMVTISNVVGIRWKKWLPGVLVALGVMVFLVAASPGYLDIYYKEVSLETVNGVTALHKVYGPWHCLYLYYLLGYFAAMVGVILYAMVKKKMQTPAQAVVLTMAVFVNMMVWLIGQLVKMNFEMLSISYLISELFLLGLYLVQQENERLKAAAALHAKAPAPASAPAAAEAEGSAMPEEVTARFKEGLAELTQTERLVYEAYTAGRSTKEIMADLNIKENTLKFHNKNLYSKLGVSSRKQLVEIYRYLKEEERLDG